MGNGDLQARVAVLEALAQSTDKRLSSIEAELRDMRKDNHSYFRLTWAGIISSFLILAGMMFHGHLRLSDRVDAVGAKVDTISQRIEAIAQAVKATPVKE